MSAPEVSVLIPVFNNAATVGAAIDAALGQQGVTVEVIAADDASTDGSFALLAARAAADPRLRPLRLAVNGGPGAARSAALAAARGEWIAVLDADDGMAPDRLARMLGAARAQGLDAAADNLALIDPADGRETGRAFPLPDDAAIRVDAERFLRNARPGGRVNLGWMQPLVRRDFLTARGIDWPPLRHGEDMVFTMRLLGAGARMTLLGAPLYRYTQRRGTASGARSAASRTRRSAGDLVRALQLVEAECGAALPAAARRRLARMPAEARAVTAALQARDLAEDGDLRGAAAEALRALAAPHAFARAVWGRVGPGARALR